MRHKLIILLALLFVAPPSLAAVVFETCGTLAIASTAALTVTVPTNDDGDLLVMLAVESDDLDPLEIVGGGWTERVQVQAGAGGDRTSAIFTRVASSEPADYTLRNTASTTEVFTGVICVFNSVHADVVDTACTSASLTDDDTPDAPNITTVTDGTIILTSVGGVQGTSGTLTGPSGFTEGKYKSITANIAGIAYKNQTTAGLETIGDWSSVGTGADTVVLTCALKPSGAAAPAFDTNPTLSSCTATGCTFNYDADAVADTIWSMFTDTAAAVPTCAAIEAGTGNHGTATEASTGASDSITITATDVPEFPLYDGHFCLEEGVSNYSAVVTVSSRRAIYCNYFYRYR